MIKKIKKIKNLAVFNDFDWDSTVRDERNIVAEFKKLNIIYGRNYAGKTTLSRILRCFEKGSLHEKYPTSEFEIQCTDGTFDQTKLNDQKDHVRVYNKDFIRENLNWLSDEEGGIKPFAIIGEKNVEIEKQIEEKKSILGEEDGSAGLRHNVKSKSAEFEAKKTEKDNAKNALEQKLRNKANNEIKRNSLYGVVTYNITSIISDIERLLKKPRAPLEDEELNSKKALLKEEPKATILPLTVVVPTFTALVETTNALLERKIKPTSPIQELLDDAVLETWVRNGIESHKNKRKTCGFCGQVIPTDLWIKLDAHFNKESEELRQSIQSHIASISNEKQKLEGILTLEKDQFYSAIRARYEAKQKEWAKEIKHYFSDLDRLIVSLEKRGADIFKDKDPLELTNNAAKIEELQNSFNDLINENNDKSISLKQDQEVAKTDLRLDEVGKFINNIGYGLELEKISTLLGQENKLKEDKENIEKQIDEIAESIEGLKIQLVDERKGADKVNEYLNHFFGNNSIKLAALEEGTTYKFIIKRGEEIAHSLSEGECSLVAFCYFMAKLEDAESSDKELVIWIDDPISSLDSNHIFFVFSLIESVIAKPFKKEDGSNGYKYMQLFISTHNLDFLKYLKRLSHPGKDSNYFIVEPGDGNSKLGLMPKYLKEYITEFNYLFHQIYKCKFAPSSEAEHDCYYNFGNNLRKFLEAYLFYKYPVNMSIKDKLEKFFKGDDTSVALTNRLDNELSHLEHIFDRSMKPTEIPEIPKLANYVLDKIKDKDEDQYKALLASIGVT